MTLGEIIREFRELHGISQRQFARMSGLSNGYISQLEANLNNKNGLPISPSLEAIKQVADAMDVPLDDVLRKLDDTLVDISGEDSEEDDLTVRIMRLVHRLPDDLKLSLLDLLRAAASGAKAK